MPVHVLCQVASRSVVGSVVDSIGGANSLRTCSPAANITTSNKSVSGSALPERPTSLYVTRDLAVIDHISCPGAESPRIISSDKSQHLSAARSLLALNQRSVQQPSLQSTDRLMPDRQSTQPGAHCGTNSVQRSHSFTNAASHQSPTNTGITVLALLLTIST